MSKEKWIYAIIFGLIFGMFLYVKLIRNDAEDSNNVEQVITDEIPKTVEALIKQWYEDEYGLIKQPVFSDLDENGISIKYENNTATITDGKEYINKNIADIAFELTYSIIIDTELVIYELRPAVDVNCTTDSCRKDVSENAGIWVFDRKNKTFSKTYTYEWRD